MIQANDLRINNIVYSNLERKEVVLNGINKTHGMYEKSSFHSLNNFEGIPLTEEWLLKFGFHFDKEYNSYSKSFLTIYDGKKGFSSDLFWDGLEIHSVHKLQNLYFALTNEELTLNENN